jgi:transposase
MNRIIMVVGIDISMDDFHACIKVRTESGKITIKGTRTFKNTYAGFEEFFRWVMDRKKEGYVLSFVMEATGVYYEDLAYFLYSSKQQVSVVLANKIKNYAKSLNIKTKTDKVDSKVIAGFGIERKLDEWKPMSPVYKELRDHCRELLSIKKEMNRTRNQLHAMTRSHNKSKSIIKLKTDQIKFYEGSIKNIEKELHKIVDKDPKLKEKLRKAQTITGIGFETSVILASETNGFALFKSIRQLVSYAGLDVEFKESGKFKGKTRITKKGNSRIRQALFMPAMSATRFNSTIKSLHERICEKNPDIKRKGIIAGMRKLLIFTFVIWKKDVEYDKNYVWNSTDIG